MSAMTYNIKTVKILACDVAMNHTGFTYTEGGKLKKFGNILPRENKKRTKNGVKISDYSTDAYKLVRLKDHFNRFRRLISSLEPDFFVIEGYSYDSKSAYIFDIGEVGGLYKLLAWERYAAIRIHDPLSIKLFFAGKARADKQDMINACEIDFKKLKYPKKSKLIKKEQEQVEDIVDSYAMNKMMYAELLLRKGIVQLHKLPEHQIMSFNRVTKAYPVNILAREFILNNA